MENSLEFPLNSHVLYSCVVVLIRCRGLTCGDAFMHISTYVMYTCCTCVVHVLYTCCTCAVHVICM